MHQPPRSTISVTYRKKNPRCLRFPPAEVGGNLPPFDGRTPPPKQRACKFSEGKSGFATLRLRKTAASAPKDVDSCFRSLKKAFSPCATRTYSRFAIRTRAPSTSKRRKSRFSCKNRVGRMHAAGTSCSMFYENTANCLARAPWLAVLPWLPCPTVLPGRPARLFYLCGGPPPYWARARNQTALCFSLVFPTASLIYFVEK